MMLLPLADLFLFLMFVYAIWQHNIAWALFAWAAGILIHILHAQEARHD